MSAEGSANHKKPETRRGFTLVEMMVSVALVLLMMIMFAEIFQIATGMMSQQRGMAENDQRARTLETIFRYDLENLTFKKIVPFYEGEVADVSQDFGLRRGFFYISENDPDNNADDVLHFTANVANAREGYGELPYYGRAALLTVDMNGNSSVIDDLLRNLNQPEFDNGQVIPDGTGASKYAQIAYFLRNGNLYRRVMLIRDPPYTEPAGDEEPKLEQSYDSTSGNWLPPSSGGTPLNFFDPASAGENSPLSDPAIYPHSALRASGIQTGNFWTDFDYSAVSGMSLAAGTNSGVDFNGTANLNNDPATSSPLTPVLGVPTNRWGHNHSAGELPPDQNAGRPREYVDHPGLDGIPGNGDDILNGYFIGRFTHEETSFINLNTGARFGYPQFTSVDGAGDPINDGNPMRINSATNPLYASLDGIVAPYAGGSRRADDLLMSNVHAFDIKVWDPSLNGYYDIGHTEIGGEFYGLVHTGALAQFNRRLHGPHWYGPQPPLLRDGNANTRVNRVFDTWHPEIDIPGVTFGTDDPPPFLPLRYRPSNTGIYWQGEWAANTEYKVGDLVVPPTGLSLYTHRLVYRCIYSDDGGGSNGTSAAAAPIWPLNEGATVEDGGGTLIWQAIYNHVPLKSIQIRILFLDTTSNQMRQITIVQELPYDG